MEPGHPPGLVQAAFTQPVGHDHGGPGRGRRRAWRPAWRAARPARSAVRPARRTARGPRTAVRWRGTRGAGPRRGGPAAARAAAAAGRAPDGQPSARARGFGELLPLPGPPGQFAEDGQGQRAVPAQQQLLRLGAEDLVEQAGGGRFAGAEGVLEPAAGPAGVPAAPVIGVPGIVDAGDQMRLAVRVGLGSGAGRSSPRRGPPHSPQRRPVVHTSAAARSRAGPRSPAAAPSGTTGCPIMTWTPVARASSSSGWLASGSITTMLAGPEGLREPLQHGDRHGVQPGEDGRVPDQPGPHPVHRLAPQDRRHGQRPGQRRPQADRAADLVGQRQRQRAGAQRERTAGCPRTCRAPSRPRRPASGRPGRWPARPW